MLLNTTLLLNDPVIVQGLMTGTLKRFGGVIREASTGQIVRHLMEAPGLTNQLASLPLSPVMGGLSLVTNLAGHAINIYQLNQVQKMLSPLLQLTQIAAGASVLSLGVSVAGFAYMGYKLNQIQTALDNVQKSMEAGFNRLDERLDYLSGQLAYLHLLVEHSRQEQQRLSKAISELYRAVLIKEIADLRAEIIDRSRYPNYPARDALKVASRVRMVLSDQAMQATPELEAQTMFISDIATQGWAVATATEAYLLLETGQIRDARELLALEIPRFREFVTRWADTLIADEQPALTTAYRFATPRFQEHISPHRIERISYISSVDHCLTKDQIRRRKNDAEIELEMFHSSHLDAQWTHRQIAVSEYLDGLSELSARLESLQAFAALCESREVKSSLELLPSSDAEPGLYVLPANEAVA